jgi:uncharacterized protein YciI
MAIHLDQFQFVLLRTPDGAPEYDDENAARIQREHLAFYAALRESGDVVTNGPFREQPDETLRGLAIYAVASLDRARELAGSDPAVLAGRLEVEAMTWLCPPGGLSRPGTPITIED